MSNKTEERRWLVAYSFHGKVFNTIIHGYPKFAWTNNLKPRKYISKKEIPQELWGVPISRLVELMEKFLEDKDNQRSPDKKGQGMAADPTRRPETPG